MGSRSPDLPCEFATFFVDHPKIAGFIQKRPETRYGLTGFGNVEGNLGILTRSDRLRTCKHFNLQPKMSRPRYGGHVIRQGGRIALVTGLNSLGVNVQV